MAEPISPDTLGSFPHLMPYIGHILLGGNELQVILAGVPSTVTEEPWQPAILSAFAKGKDGQFHQIAALTPIDLKIPVGGQGTGALAVDISTNHDAGAATVTFIFGVESQPEPTRAVTYRLRSTAGSLLVLISESPKKHAKLKGASSDPPAPGNNSPSPQKQSWGLRIKGAQDHDFQSRGMQHLAGKPVDSLWRFDAASIVTLIGLGSLTKTKTPEGDWVLMSHTDTQDNRPPLESLEGFEILFGRQHTKDTLKRRSDLTTCLSSAQRPHPTPKVDDFIAHLDTCGTKASKTSLRLTLAADDPGGAGAPYPVFVFDDKGQPLAYTALLAGETVDLAVPPDTPLRVSDTPFGRLLDGPTGSRTFTVSENQTVTIDLKPRRIGLVRIDGPENVRSAVVTLKRLDGEATIVGLKDGTGCFTSGTNGATPLRSIKEGVFLTSAWPIYCALMGSAYEVNLQHGLVGTLCVMHVYPQSDFPQKIQCQPLTHAPKVSTIGKYKFFDLAFPGEAWTQGYMNIAQEPDSSTAVPLKNVLLESAKPDLLEEGPFGWMGTHFQAKALPVRGAVATGLAISGETADSREWVSILRLLDESSGVTLQYLPAGVDFVRNYDRFKQRRPGDSVGALLDAIQATETEGFLELGCPSAGQALFDYALMVKRIQPDGLRLFGCPSGASEEDLVALWARQSLEQKRPSILTAGSPIDTLPDGGFPRLAYSADDGNKKSSLLRALMNRTTFVTRGPSLDLTVQTAQPPISPREKKNTKNPVQIFDYIVTISLDQVPLEPTEKWHLKLFTDQGLAKTVEYPRPGGGDGKVLIPISAPSSVHWVRAELTRAQGLGKNGPRFLAATNWKALSAEEIGPPKPDHGLSSPNPQRL